MWAAGAGGFPYGKAPPIWFAGRLVPMLELGALFELLIGGKGADPICFAAGTMVRIVNISLLLVWLFSKVV